MSQIFISYRREDGQASAGRLYDRLVETFGQKNVFMDVDAITYGENFAEAIDAAVGQCKVLIAIIGRNWTTLSDKNGKQRLAEPNDFVRLEIAAALKRNIRVIPVLVENARIPSPSELPADLQPLLSRNAIEIHHTSFNSDADRLIATLRKIITRRRRVAFMIGILTVALVAVGAIIMFWDTKDSVRTNADPFMVKVRLINPQQPTQSFNEGELAVYVGKELKKSEIRNGEASLFNIPARLNNTAARVELMVPGYQLRDSANIVLARDKDYIDLAVVPTEASKSTFIRGSVVNERNSPVRNALVNVGSGLATGYTDQNGDFSFNVPLRNGERTRIKIIVNNSTLYNEDVVLSTSTPIQVKVDVYR